MKDDELIVHTDGGARGNPGPAACAFIAEISGKVLNTESLYLGRSTNNYDEYQGVILALGWIKDNYKNLKISTIFLNLDSELVVRQLNGIYKVKDINLIKLHQQSVQLCKNIGLKFIIKNIPRSQNKVADFLVNKELDKNLIKK